MAVYLFRVAQVLLRAPCTIYLFTLKSILDDIFFPHNPLIEISILYTHGLPAVHHAKDLLIQV